MEDELSLIAGGSAEDGDEAVLETIIVRGQYGEQLNLLPPVFVKAIELGITIGAGALIQWAAIPSKENVTNNLFDPAKTSGDADGWDGDGNIVHGKLMTDGSSFWDMDGNGKYDVIDKVDDQGNYYRNIGDGFIQVSR